MAEPRAGSGRARHDQPGGTRNLPDLSNATADCARERIPPSPVPVVCGLGASYAFGGAFCRGLLNGWMLAASARYGNAAGAIVASRLMCADDIPTRGEVATFLTGRRT